MIFSGVVAPRISAGVNSIQFLRRSSRSCIRNASARETTGAPIGNGCVNGRTAEVERGGACKVLPKSSDSGGSGESDGRLEKTVSPSGEENKMDCPGRGAARWAWTENTATHTARQRQHAFQICKAETHLKLSG